MANNENPRQRTFIFWKVKRHAKELQVKLKICDVSKKDCLAEQDLKIS